MLFQSDSHVAIDKCTFSHCDVYDTLRLVLGDGAALYRWHLTRVISSIIIGVSSVLQEWILAVVITKMLLFVKLSLVLNMTLLFQMQFVPILDMHFELEVDEIEVHEVRNAIQDVPIVDHHISHPLFDSRNRVGHDQKYLVQLNADQFRLLKQQILFVKLHLQIF